MDDYAIHIGWSKRTLRTLKNPTIDLGLEKEIKESIEGNREMRQQMRRVFDAANKRIKALEKDDYLSPALAALNTRHFGIGEFKSNTGESWDALKKQYAQAVAFMRSPTSTVTGSKDFSLSIKNSLGLEDEEWEVVKEDLGRGFEKDPFLAVGNWSYPKLVQEIYSQAVEATASEMENEARIARDAIEREIEATAKALNLEISAEVEQSIDELLEGFNRLS